jgi:hypothetical protein
MPLGSINRLGGLASNFAEPSGAGPSRTPNPEPSALDPLAVASDRQSPDARFGARATALQRQFDHARNVNAEIGGLTERSSVAVTVSPQDKQTDVLRRGYGRYAEIAGLSPESQKVFVERMMETSGERIVHAQGDGRFTDAEFRAYQSKGSITLSPTREQIATLKALKAEDEGTIRIAADPSVARPAHADEAPRSPLRDPMPYDPNGENWGAVAVNAASNTLNDLVGGDFVAERAYTIGDHRRPTEERVKAAAELGGHTVLQAAPQIVIGPIARGARAAVRGEEMITLGLSERAAESVAAREAERILPKLEDVVNREAKPGDPLPEGYHWTEGRIQRNPNAIEKGHARLEYQDGKIVLSEGVERLSNPAMMKRNFETTVRAELQAKGLKGVALEQAVQRELGRVQIHHVIPDELVRNTELGRAAQKAGYNLDRSENLTGLAKSAEAKLSPDEIGHWTNHPKYTKAVREKMDDAVKELNAKYGSLEKAPKDAILQKMKNIEDEFRKLIESKGATTKDGRLAMLPSASDWRRV